MRLRYFSLGALVPWCLCVRLLAFGHPFSQMEKANVWSNRIRVGVHIAKIDTLLLLIRLDEIHKLQNLFLGKVIHQRFRHQR